MTFSLRNRRLWLLAGLTALLLFAGWLRLRSFVDFVEWPDEVWSVWHVRGTLGDALLRTPYDWPPLFTLTSWLWVQVVGPRLEASRYLMILISLLGVAFCYRAARALFSAEKQDAQWGFLVALIYAVGGFSLFTSIEVRAYAVLYVLGPLALWLMLRWLHKPTLRRSIPLILTLAAMIYTSYTSVIFVGLVATLALWLRPHLWLRWLGVGLGIVLVALPILPKFLSVSAGRVNIQAGGILPFADQMAEIYRLFGGATAFYIPLGLAVLALVVFLLMRPASRRLTLALLVWAAAPVGAYFVLHYQEYVSTRYLWWVMIGLALLIGWAAVHLPRPVRWLTVAFFVAMPLFPVDFSTYRIGIRGAAPMRAMLGWLQERIRPGDVLVIDPNCNCGEGHVWDYFLPQYFPSGWLPIVRQPGDAARVWYLYESGAQDPDVAKAVNDGRVSGEFVGPWYFSLRLFEGAPLQTGIAFGDRVELRGAEIVGNRTTFAEGETLEVRLWWGAAVPLDVDYSFSLALIDGHGNIVAQSDGPISGQPQQTSQWQPGQVYTDTRSLRVPDNLDFITDYRLVVTVYQWWDGTRLVPAANALYPTTRDAYLVLKTITIKAW